MLFYFALRRSLVQYPQEHHVNATADPSRPFCSVAEASESRQPSGVVCTLIRKEIVMVKVRIKGGTPEEGATLCVSCSWGLVRRGSSAAEEEIVCRATTPAGRVPFRIRECSAYADSRLPTLYSMEKIA